MDFTEYSDIELSFRLVDLRYRKTGRSTRLVDTFVQQLFDRRGEWVEIFDHFRGRQANEMLVRRIQRRLMNEHGITNNDLEFDRDKCALRLVAKELEFSQHKYEIEQIEQEIERRKKKNL